MATVLSCAMTLTTPNAALAGKSIQFNVVLAEATAAQMAVGDVPVSPVSFADQKADVRQWVVHNELDVTKPQIMVGRVIPARNAAKPLFMRWGLATREGAGSNYRFEEKMHGLCQLVPKESLQ